MAEAALGRIRSAPGFERRAEYFVNVDGHRVAISRMHWIARVWGPELVAEVYDFIGDIDTPGGCTIEGQFRASRMMLLAMATLFAMTSLIAASFELVEHEHAFGAFVAFGAWAALAGAFHWIVAPADRRAITAFLEDQCEATSMKKGPAAASNVEQPPGL